MPRQPRIDSPDLLHHVIVRGIERNDIFRDDEDRISFLERLQMLLAKTETECFAWALIPNHFHLLLRPRRLELSRFMRRLLTGHAVTFNRRHKRSGHLFQNRYKSIVCEENTYLLELIRYIHLNPLRAGLVKNFPALDRYRWCGHAELLGRGQKVGLSVDEVLQLFSQKQTSARANYRQFMADGVALGKRPELVGGGLRRSQILQSSKEEISDYDERVLGSGEFVTALRVQGVLDPAVRTQMSLNDLQAAVANLYDLPFDSLLRRTRLVRGSEARALFCYCAVQKFGHPGATVSKHLGVGASSVSRAVQRGELLIESDVEVRRWVDSP